MTLAINDRGQVLINGEGLVPASVTPHLWDPIQSWTPLPSGEGFDYATWATAMNNGGQVVGWRRQGSPMFLESAFVWSLLEGNHDLEPPGCEVDPAVDCTTALAISDVGEIAGKARPLSNPAWEVVRWQRDGDHIADLIDVGPDVTCTENPGGFYTDCAFDDWSSANPYYPFTTSLTSDGTTYGKVVRSNGNKVVVVDNPPTLAPEHGVTVYNFGGNPNNPGASFQACGFPFDITGWGGAPVHCSTLDLAVGAGEWTIEIPGSPVVIPAGAAVSVEEAGPGSYSITSDPRSVATVMVGEVPLLPGETVLVSTNAPPTVAITAPESGTVVAVGTPLTFAGSFADDAGDTHTATWTFGSTTIPGTVTEGESGGTVSDTYAFLAGGVYPVTLTVTDQGGASGSANAVGDLPAFVVVYDPDGGFATGGGWIPSPPGAFAGDPAATGKASFGFVAKYQKGRSLPTGETEFQFQVADLSFHSASYDWLVCSGPKCQFKGHGTVNGVSGYSFLLTAIDGDLPGGGGQDKLRMKIWVTLTGEIVYDNQMGADDFADPTTAIGGGSIVIHKG